MEPLVLEQAYVVTRSLVFGSKWITVNRSQSVLREHFIITCLVTIKNLV